MTSNIQTQINSQMPKSGGTFTGAITLASAGIVSNGLTISNIEVGYLDGVTSNIQTQINSKANLSGATFTGAITLASAGIISNGLTISNVELGYLDGLSSNLQTQLNQTFSNDANNASAITVLQTKTTDLTYSSSATTSKSTFAGDVIASQFQCPVFKSITNNMVSSSRTVNDTGLGGTYNVSSHYTRTISFICPLSILLISSVYGVGNVFSATFNSITSCTIYKNGVSFSTPTITSANGVNGLWTTGQVTAITAPKVEFYLTTVSGSFTPDDDCNTAIYTVEFVFSVSKTNSSYAKVQINTLTTGKIEYNASCSYTGTRNASYLTASFSEVDNYLNDRYGLFEVGRMNTLDIKTNGNNTTTGNISSDTLSINSVSTTGSSISVTSPLSISGLCSSSTLNVSSYSTLNKTYYSGMIGAYICEGSIGANNQLRPIFSSVLAYSNFYVYNQASQSISVGTIHSTAIDLYGTDTNCYLVNPGFRLIVYGLNNYAGSVYLDYTNNTNISTFVIPTSTGVGQSCKLYFNGTQIN
jgi:hypothetical protein